jgi:hypothetical protein
MSLTQSAAADGQSATWSLNGSPVVVLEATGLTGLKPNSVTPAKLTQPLTLGTAQATTSGTFKDFTGIPSWAKRITIGLVGVSTNGGSDFLVQIGAGSVSNTGYLGASSRIVGGVVSANYTTGFGINNGTQSATYVTHGSITLTLVGTNTWVASGTFGDSSSANTTVSGGSKSLGGVLDMVRLTTVNGTDTFDAGSVNIMYE